MAVKSDSAQEGRLDWTRRWPNVSVSNKEESEEGDWRAVVSGELRHIPHMDVLVKALRALHSWPNVTWPEQASSLDYQVTGPWVEYAFFSFIHIVTPVGGASLLLE